MSTMELEKKMVRIKLTPPVMKARMQTTNTQPESRHPKKVTGKSPPAKSVSSKGFRAKVASSKTSSASIKSEQKPAGPSIFGILMSRRLARNYVQRFRQGRQQPTIERPIPPTYQLEPTACFDPARVEPLIKNAVDARMRTFRYHQTTAALLAKILATECKDAVKTLNYSRYKLVCQVFIGERKDQSAAVSSQCAWDTSTDSVVTYNWQSASVYCVVTMHAIYHY